MKFDESIVLGFINNLVNASGEDVFSCSNWVETGRLFASAFLKTAQPDALYVMVNGESFQILSDLENQSSNFDLLIVMMKQAGVISDQLPLIAQIHVINIPGVNKSVYPSTEPDSQNSEIPNREMAEQVNRDVHRDSYGQIMNLVLLAITPYFDFVAHNEVSDTSSASLSATKKKFNELTISLRHLQNRIQIPDLLATVPQHLKKVLSNPESPQDPAIVSDSEVLNDLTKIVNSWIQQIQAVTNVAKSISEGNSLQDEIQFWAVLETTLVSLREQTLQSEVKCAIDILNAAKRFQVTLAFQNNLGISESLEETRSYNDLLKDLPIAELTLDSDSPKEGAKSVEKLEMTIGTLFSHLKRWKGSNSLSLTRMIALVELLLEEIAEIISRLLVSLDLVGVTYQKFLACLENLDSVFRTVEINVKFMVNIIRELMRKRQEKFMVIKIESALLNSIKERVETLVVLRRKHEELLQALYCLEGADSQIQHINLAFSKQLVPSSPFDFSKQGASLWETSHQLYTDAFTKVSENMCVIINRNFERSQTFVEYLCLFDKIVGESSLDSSNLILSFIDDRHKLDILDVASAEIDNLLSLSYSATPQSSESDSIFKSLSRELLFKIKADFYLNNLRKLLGEDWNSYSVGSKIEMKLASYYQRANIDGLFTKWIENATQVSKNSSSLGNVLRVEEATENNISKLVVDFNAGIDALLNQEESLLNLGFEVPSTLRVQLSRHRAMQPIVFSLFEHVSLFEEIVLEVSEKTDYGTKFGFLVEEQKQKIYTLLKRVSDISWLSILSEMNVKESGEGFSENLRSENSPLAQISLLQENIHKIYCEVNVINRVYERLYNIHIRRLSECLYTLEDVSNKMLTIREEVTEIIRADYCDIGCFVQIVNHDLMETITKRCQKELHSIASCISEYPYSEGNFEGLEPRTHAINFADGLFSVYPPLESSKSTWVGCVNKTLELTENLELISLDDGLQYFCYHDSENLSKALTHTMSVIEWAHESAKEYFSKWVLMQNLFSEEDRLEEKRFTSGMSIEECMKTAEEIINLRNVFDNKNGYHKINGVMNITFVGIELQVSKRFESIENKVLEILVNRSQSKSKMCFDELAAAQKTLLIEFDFEGAPSSVLNSVGEIFSVKSKVADWSEHISCLARCQSYLYHQNIPASTNWIYVEQLEGQISNVKSLLSKSLEKISSNYDSLNLKILSEWSDIQDASRSLSEDWKENKPISATLEPSAALAVLAKYKSKVRYLFNHKRTLLDIAASMELDLEVEEVLEILEDDISELKVVWSTIQNLWDNLENLKRQKWGEIHVRNLKHQLEDIISDCNDCPMTVRQYSAFSSLQGAIRGFLKKIPVLSELKSDAMKERHWTQLFSLIGSKQKSKEVVLVKDVLDINFQMNEVVIRNILEKANGEQVVQESLEKINEEWSSIIFETFSHNGKCRLVKNWSFLFDQCATNLGTLASIKHSLFHGEFERERDELESKLNDLTSLLNTWIDVQRQWVYLDGVFGSNNEIKASLPLESSRFDNISFEFLSLLKKASSVNLVIEILSIKDLPKAMGKLSDSLVKTVRGLTDFVDKQRDRFPRFFFLGNEDLLELLGSGNDAAQINKHMKKMFPGVFSVSIDRDTSEIISVTSVQGEIIVLDTPVSLIKNRALAQWLGVLETEIKITISVKICQAVKELEKSCQAGFFLVEESTWSIIDKVPQQVLLVAFQVHFTSRLELGLQSGDLKSDLEFYKSLISILSSLASKNDDIIFLSKVRCLIIESLHHQETFESLIKADASLRTAIWNSEQLFYCKPDEKDPFKRIFIKQGRFKFSYGFEYLGVVERLAITPLVNKCFLAMSQALAQKLGGSPFGPAGTGKTECVKALGQNLGRMVLVFCCDDSFDFQSMGRILLGICKVGCWGCFDEFNRLEPKILSSLSTQLERIETSLQISELVSVSEKMITVNPETGIFVTMNPDYIGRNDLPENLKKLFRGFAMNKPDKEIIAEVILTSHGFRFSKDLSNILIPFFQQLQMSVSIQSHYDFGLRALKSILNKAGAIRKKNMVLSQSPDVRSIEISVLSKSLIETIGPKLVKGDDAVFEKMLSEYNLFVDQILERDAQFVTKLNNYAIAEGLQFTKDFSQKALQVFQIQQSHHGFMLVGHSGSGKSTVMDSVLSTLSTMEGEPFKKYTIDSKVMTKDTLFGALDPVTRDWTDGLLTKIIRNISANMKGELDRRTWIVFDGDIDPEWAENLNSLLDDNKLLTLPNGERLELPENVRIVFEVSNLDHATPATVSRCAMIWFDVSLVEISSLWRRHIHLLKHSLGEISESEDWVQTTRTQSLVNEIAEMLLGLEIEPLIKETFTFVSNLSHIMDIDSHRLINGLFVYLKIHISKLSKHVEFDSGVGNLETFVYKALVLSIIWAFSGDCSFEEKEKLRDFIEKLEPFSHLEIPKNVSHCRISLPDFEWDTWSTSVGYTDLEPHQVLDPGTIVPTMDTVMHESLIHGIINKHSPLILCGPPGSGKTMTLFKALRSSSNLELISLNFSKDTSPEALLSTLEQHCEYKVTNVGLELSPKFEGKWAVVFCDEINLPAVDNYGTQRVISFMRQMVERSGFWRPSDLSWITLRNIQFVGACNNPNDPGRNKLSDRFMRHVTLVMVDYPGPQALRQIYTSLNDASLKCAPSIRSYSDALTNAMIDVYESTRLFLTAEKQGHYIYSPRELTRWCRGLLETLMNVTYSSLSELIRLWYHEGLRLFYDRLVSNEDREWCKNLFWTLAAKNFPNVDLNSVLKGPVLYSTWLTGEYESVSEGSLTAFVRQRLKVFSEEEMENKLILFEDWLDHALRIDRVLRQHQGHMILVGPSTSGKTCLTKFVTWMNGMRLVQLKVHSNFTIAEFEASLRDVLICCVKGEQICYLIDESSILEASFIERMNTLLANSEIPGLFEGENLDNLIKLCANEASARGLILDTAEEIYKWFTNQVSENLHVAFTMSELQNKNTPQINSSPALFNRCVMSWMGDWSDCSLKKAAESLLDDVPLDQSTFVIPSGFTSFTHEEISTFRGAVIDAFVFMHRSFSDASSSVVPKQFLDFIDLFKQLFTKGQRSLEENQRHLNIGLDKLRETVLEVSQMKKVLSEKKSRLQIKDEEARKMLNQMIMDQNESERKREFSVATKAELEKQEAEIQSRRSIVMKDLELAEPAVIEAQRGVQNIKKQHLTELRSMSNPPASIKLALESVCILLGYQVSTWRDVQLFVRQDDFITNIVSFDNETRLSPELRAYMEDVYLSRPDYNYETIHRASKACGPILQWVIAQIKYSEILVRVGPLREQVAALEAYATKSKAQLIAIGDMISELEQSIESYKDKYSEVIRQAEKIKTEMSDIEQKMNRSMKLIENLTKERQRWLASTKGFQEESERLTGNSILGSAFATYCGNLNQRERQDLIALWKRRLEESGIKFDRTMGLASLLTTNTEGINWLKSGLPEDDLFFENFAIKSRSEFPLIIDPAGDVLTVLKTYNNKDLIVTSFLSDSFAKTLEDALRFGGTVLVQNTELYNPILDSILRKDVSHKGGRKIVQFGSKSLVLSEQFRLILYTRDSRITVSSFLRSRTVLINFSITRSNLENRVLNVSLEHFNPELERKRVELEALQSEYNYRSLNLRKSLLATLNELKGTFLDNDEVIDSLEEIESESKIIDERMAESEKILVSVNEERLYFGEVAAHSKDIFDIIMSLAKTNRFYNFSFAGFIDLFKRVLIDIQSSVNIQEIVMGLYCMVYRFFSPTLLKTDKLLFCLCLTASYHGIKFGPRVKDAIASLLQAINYGCDAQKIEPLLESWVTEEEMGSLVENWEEIVRKYENIEDFRIVSGLVDEVFGLSTAMSKHKAIETYCSTVFDNRHNRELQLDDWIRQTVGPHIFATSESYDVTFQIKESARAANTTLVKVSMGAKEGVKAANEALDSAMQKGHWVLIQNIQMSPLWLTHLKGALQNKTAMEGFKLFLTCSLDATNIPNELIGMSSVLTMEEQPQWKAMLLNTFDCLVKPETSVLELQIFFLLSWYHTTIQERLKYVPISFRNNYDINESDLLAAGFAIGQMFSGEASKSKTMSDFSWTEIAYRVGEIIYGGKIPVAEDSHYCVELAKSVFHADSHKPGFSLISNAVAEERGMKLPMPDANSVKEYRDWISGLPENVPLEWFGLEGGVSDTAKEEEARIVAARCSKLLQMSL